MKQIADRLLRLDVDIELVCTSLKGKADQEVSETLLNTIVEIVDGMMEIHDVVKSQNEKGLIDLYNNMIHSVRLAIKNPHKDAQRPRIQRDLEMLSVMAKSLLIKPTTREDEIQVVKAIHSPLAVETLIAIRKKMDRLKAYGVNIPLNYEEVMGVVSEIERSRFMIKHLENAGLELKYNEIIEQFTSFMNRFAEQFNGTVGTQHHELTEYAKTFVFKHHL